MAYEKSRAQLDREERLAKSIAHSKEMAEKSLDYCDDGTLYYIPEATHWVLHEKPEIVNSKMIEFFSD